MQSRRSLLSATLFTPFLSRRAQAGDYPDKPVQILISTPTGQATDTLARLLGSVLSRAFGQQFIADNRPGAGGMLALEAAARARPDGYTLVMATSGPMAINPSLYRNLRYDPLKDFAPISNLGIVAQTLVVSANSQFKSAADLVARVRERPGTINFASSGNGTTGHLTMQMLCSRLVLDVVHVPYRGSPAAILDVISGSVDALFDAMPGVLGQIRDGKLRALAVSTLQRSAFLPDVPTIAETVAPGFDAAGWIGIAAPAKTPATIVEKLYSEIVKALADPETKHRMADLAFTPVSSTPDEFSVFIRSEVNKWAGVVKDAGASVD